MAVLYKYDNGDYEKALDETIDALTRRRLPPDRILIVCPKGHESGIRDEFQHISSATKERLRAVTHVLLACFDTSGRVSRDSTHQLSHVSPEWTLSEADMQAVVEAGMDDIIDSTGTRMTAPPGYVFRKPSENTKRVFIRAGNMVREPAALAVIFHALIRRIPLGMKRLYIDSFTILSIALTYQHCMSKLAKACAVPFEEPTITNFHSYSMDPLLTFEAAGDYVILISATTSGGLAAKLVEERRARESKIFHLLAFSEKTSLQNSAVFFRKEASEDGDDDAMSFRKIISIPGEEFLASHGDTRTVDIGFSHLVSAERKIYKDPFYQEALCLNLREGARYGSAFRPVGLTSNGIGSQEFIEWVEHQVHIELPGSIKLVVSADDDGSALLTDHIVPLLSKLTREQITHVKASDLEKELGQAQNLDSGTVLVVASDESGGDGLLAISQALRDKPKLHRHYLIGHLFPSSARQFRKLRSSLTTSGTLRKYGWSNYCATPVGDDISHQTWLQEREFDYSSCHFGGAPQLLIDALHARGAALKQASLKGDSLFLPKIDGGLLQLRNDSVLFEKGYGKISQTTVYVQVAAALQRARDRALIDGKTVLVEKMCFESNPFVDTVIDPDTFSRFNDGIIQAAIFRSASHSELNYSRDSKLSQHMLRIFSGVVQSRHRPRGEAVLEFMLAAYLKKLRLEKEHFEEIVKLIVSEPELKAVWDSFSVESVF